MTRQTTRPQADPAVDELLARWRTAARRVSSEAPGSPAFDAAVEGLIEARHAYDVALRSRRQEQRWER